MPTITEIPDWFGLEGTLKCMQFQLPAMGRNTFHWIRVLQALSNVAMDTSKDGPAIPSHQQQRLKIIIAFQQIGTATVH